MNSLINTIIKRVEFNEQTINTVIGGLVLIVVISLLANYYLSNNKLASPPTQVTQSQEIPNRDQIAQGVTSSTSVARYQVTAEDTLWSIAAAQLGDGHRWSEIAEINNLSNPDLIEVGILLDLPTTDIIETEIQSQPDIAGSTSFTYQVNNNDSLWSIAENYYQDGYRWIDIWETNKELVPNPNILTPGINLTIPE